MQVNFSASQLVSIPVPHERVPIQHYLRQPYRLMNALTDSSRVESVGKDLFRLTMKSRQFLMLSFQPVVDLKVWSEPNGTVHVKSIACEIRGVDYINQRFQLDLDGKIYPVQMRGQTHLAGSGDLKVSVVLPPIFWMTPQPILEAAGHSLLQGILLSFKQRLGHQLISDYRQWVGTTDKSSTAELNPALSVNPSVVMASATRSQL
jgi:hypothetical protein